MNRLALCGALALTVPFFAPSPSPATASPASCCAAPTVLENSPLDPIRKLVGTWVACDETGKPTDTVISVMKETAGGSAIVETLFPGAPEEMISIYSLDEGKLMLQHYCVMGNAPVYEASVSADRKTHTFQCKGGGNLKDHDRAHMHEGTMVLLGDDLMDSRWLAIANGETVEDVKLMLARKRDAVK
jgi:hypothetical protein